MTLNEIVLTLVILSLGLLVVNVLKPRLLFGIAGALVSAAIIWELWLVIAASGDPTQSNPLWLVCYAEAVIAVGSLLSGMFGKKK